MCNQSMHRLLMCVALALCAEARGQSAELLKAEAFEGSFSFHSSDSGTESRYGNDIAWSYQGDVDGTFVLDTFKDDTPPTWSGHWTGNASIHWKFQETKYVANCGNEEEVRTKGVVTNPNPRHGDMDLRLHQNGWEIRLWRNQLPDTDVRSCVFPDGHKRTEQFAFAEFIPFGSPILPYAASGSQLSATYTVLGPIGLGTHVQRLQAAPWRAEVHAQPQGDLILEVEASAYDHWRPSAVVAKDGKAGPGTPIEFTATLKHKSGKPAGVAIDRVEWELVDTSREPGVAINYPLSGGNDFDLQFELLPKQVVVGDLQHVRSSIVDKGTDRARIVPLDWGGWSVLKVTAYVHDGPAVVGRYVGTRDSDIRLPKRAANSLIADVWKKETGATGADDADDDNSPIGDGASPGGINGDGLTLYEEYRGWYERGAHRSGNPKVKDYFFYNEAGEMVRSAARLLQRSSGLAAHELGAAEFNPQTRIVNQNHGKGPHVVDQHGVLIRFDLANAPGWSFAYGGPATPGSISHIGLTPDLRGGADDERVAAHEMLHSVNVHHHGDGDFTAVVYAVGDQLHAGSKTGSNVRLLAEDGYDATAVEAWVAGDGNALHLWLGLPNGQHSGFEGCLMRYAVAQAYPSSRTQGVLYSVASEVNGEAVCSTTTGVGVNASSHSPQSRYSTAAAGRGNCAAQIRVSDRGASSHP